MKPIPTAPIQKTCAQRPKLFTVTISTEEPSGKHFGRSAAGREAGSDEERGQNGGVDQREADQSGDQEACVCADCDRKNQNDPVERDTELSQKTDGRVKPFQTSDAVKQASGRIPAECKTAEP